LTPPSLQIQTIRRVVIDRVLVDPIGNENSNSIPEIIEIANFGDATVDLADRAHSFPTRS
jgi:hypothetical protein